MRYSAPTLRAIAIYGPNASPRNRESLRCGKSLEWLQTELRPGVADIAVIFGGDGTAHRHLPELVETKIPLLVVPSGSGNDFARALGLASRRKAELAWQRFCNRGDNIRDIDLGVITAAGPLANGAKPVQRFYCCVAGVGVDSETNRLANKLPRFIRAHGGYVLSLFPALARYKAQCMSITALDGSGGSLSAPAMFATFANCPSYGHGLKIAPTAQLDDGVVDVCFLRRLNKIKLLTLFPLVYWGRHLGIREVEYFSGKRFRVESEVPMDVFADGEYVCQTPVEVGVRAQALRVVVAG